MSAGTTGLVFDPIYRQHTTGPGHPERPERLHAILAALTDQPWAGEIRSLQPRQAAEDEILACHSQAYFDRAVRDIRAGRDVLTTGDTNICPASLDAALLAAGGAITAVDAVADATVHNAFCAVRPPGHHATGERGMGFCIFNNVAVAARYAQRARGLARILIIDWDVHHGNGTQDIFYDDPSVLFFSTHQSPLYPGTGAADETGAGPGQGATLNCPLPPGAGSDEILAAFHDSLLPAADRFAPDLVLISAGFDSHADDPLAALRLRDEDFAELTRLVLDIARRHAGGRCVSCLEGGYYLPALADAVAAHVAELVRAQ